MTPSARGAETRISMRTYILKSNRRIFLENSLWYFVLSRSETFYSPWSTRPAVNHCWKGRRVIRRRSATFQGPYLLSAPLQVRSRRDEPERTRTRSIFARPTHRWVEGLKRTFFNSHSSIYNIESSAIMQDQPAYSGSVAVEGPRQTPQVNNSETEIEDRTRFTDPSSFQRVQNPARVQ